MKFNHLQFAFARELKGFSQTQLAQKIKGLSQSNLSKFEKGFDVLAEDKIIEIINFLGFPISFFYKKIGNNVELAHYRKKSGTTKALKIELECNNRMLGYLVDCFSEDVDFPDFALTPLNPEDYTPEEIARYTRKTLKVSADEPIVDICNLLESKGIIIIELDNVSDKFDGVSFFTDKGTPLIIINKDFSNDRKRFTIAHELGHILMHNSGDFPVPEHRTDNQKENEANRFSAEFLMPEKAIKNSLVGLRLSDLSPLKKRWKTSKASIIKRAKDLHCIPENKAKYFMIELSRNGERKHEKTNVEIDNPVLMKEAYLLYQNLKYSNSDLANAFSVPKYIIDKYFTFDRPNLFLSFRNQAPN